MPRPLSRNKAAHEIWNSLVVLAYVSDRGAGRGLDDQPCVGLPAQLRFAGLVCWLLRSLAISILAYDGSSVGFLFLDRCWSDVLSEQVLSVSFYRCLLYTSDAADE